ncbi:MAG: FG-GAP repeat protein [candidate division Zixibacteria bacterium]|nr:FG-GAP repeat protein [candidate division Zixibacteria bacterium]
MSGIAFSQPQLDIKPSPLKFGYISINGIQTREIVLCNVGNNTLTIDSCVVEPPFYMELLSDIIIEPDDSIAASIIFYPEQEYTFLDEILFYVNGAAECSTLTISGHGIREFESGEIIWSYQHIEDVVCLVVADDYNLDGMPDIMAEGYNIGASGDPLACLSGSGDGETQVIWTARPEGGQANSGGWGDQCLANTGDLNGDGFNDILRGGAWSCRTIFGINGFNGSTIWLHDTYEDTSSGWIHAVARTDDITGDGIPEALACSGSNANAAYCFDGSDGEQIWKYYAGDAIGSIASIMSVNGDFFNEAVFASRDINDENVYCISGASEEVGERVWRCNIHEDTYSLSIISDINDDGYPDIIAGSWGSGVFALSGSCDDESGEIIWNFPMISYTMKAIACPDLDNDGYEDILAAAWSSYALALSGVDGSEIWRFTPGDDIWTVYYTADVTGDSIAEIIAGCFDNNVYLIDGANGNQLWHCDVNARPLTVRYISDVNGDSYDDVIVGTEKNTEAGGEVILIAGGPSEHSYIPVKETSIPKNFLAVSNYPNPFNSTAVIKFNLDCSCDLKLSIYDITGRLVDCISSRGQTGINTIKWDITDRSEIVSGVYFYKLKTGTQTGYGKMIYLK